MKRILKHILLLAVLINLLIAQTAERKNMAIYNFTALGVSNIEARVISDRIRTEIGKFDTYSIIERGLMEQILEEQVLQLSGLCDDASCLVEVGQILAVHYMVGGSISKIGNLYTIDARVIDVESGKIVNSVVEDYNGPIENLLVQTTKIVAAKLSGKAEGMGSVLLTSTCDLLVTSNPPGGTIYINDKPIGDVTPYRLEGLREGEYVIKVRKGNLIGEATTSLVRNDRKELTVNLGKEQFILRIYTKPAGAYVSISQSRFVKTPYDYIATDTSIDYRIHLRKDLYFDHEEVVHFPKATMLRLNYNLEPCGQISIVKQEGMNISIDDIELSEYPKAKRSTDTRLRNAELWVIDQLEFSNYQIRIEKEHHQAYEQMISLTSHQPAQNINYELDLIKANIVIKSNVDGSGKLKDNRFSIVKLFKLSAGNNTNVFLPFGNYVLQTTAPGYLPINRELALFNQHPSPIVLNFQRPDKRLALKQSLLFPGMGQIYSKQPKKGIILSGITAAGLGWLINSIFQYSSELASYNDLADRYSTATTIADMDDYRTQLNASKDQLNNYRYQFMAATSLTLASYSWNIFDITVRYPYE